MNRITQLEDSRRQFLIKLLAAGAFVGGMSGMAGCASSSTRPVEKLPAGQSIYQLLGSVTVNGKLANLKTLVSPGDKIETGDKSFVIFVVAGEAIILRSNSSMILAKATVNPAKLAGIDLVKGKMLSVFTPREKLYLRTPSAVIAIRGTGVYLESEESESYFCTCYGTTDIGVRNNSAISETVVSSHHDRPVYIIDNKTDQRIVDAPFKNHDDEELLLIETLVGRTTPFVVPIGANRTKRHYY